MPRDYYEVLGVGKIATQADIRKAYLKLAREYHPDTSERPNATEIMQEVNEAYEILSDEGKRAKYDAMGLGPRQRDGTPQSAPFGGTGGQDWITQVIDVLNGKGLGLGGYAGGFGFGSPARPARQEQLTPEQLRRRQISELESSLNTETRFTTMVNILNRLGELGQHYAIQTASAQGGHGKDVVTASQVADTILEIMRVRKSDREQYKKLIAQLPRELGIRQHIESAVDEVLSGLEYLKNPSTDVISLQTALEKIGKQYLSIPGIDGQKVRLQDVIDRIYNLRMKTYTYNPEKLAEEASLLPTWEDLDIRVYYYLRENYWDDAKRQKYPVPDHMKKRYEEHRKKVEIH